MEPNQRGAADKRRSSSQQTAPLDGSEDKFVVTHPFHPLYRQEFEVLGQNDRWGDWRVWFKDANGAVRTIPLAFTSLAPSAFSGLSAGRADFFRASDLLELADLICGLQSTSRTSVK